MIAADRSFPNGSPVCDYWLARCEGFTVRAGHRTLGVVEAVERDGSHANAVVLRKGRRRRRTLHSADVLAAVPARKELLVRRQQHAVPAIRRAYATVKPVAISLAAATAAALHSVAVWIAATLRREVPRLTQRLLAEIHDRNEHHGDEPSVARTHRKANEYDYRLSTRAR